MITSYFTTCNTCLLWKSIFTMGSLKDNFTTGIINCRCPITETSEFFKLTHSWVLQHWRTCDQSISTGRCQTKARRASSVSFVDCTQTKLNLVGISFISNFNRTCKFNVRNLKVVPSCLIFVCSIFDVHLRFLVALQTVWAGSLRCVGCTVSTCTTSTSAQSGWFSQRWSVLVSRRGRHRPLWTSASPTVSWSKCKATDMWSSCVGFRKVKCSYTLCVQFDTTRY